MKNKTILCLNSIPLGKYDYENWFSGYTVLMVCNENIYSQYKHIFPNIFPVKEYNDKDHLYNYINQHIVPNFKLNYIIALSENDLILAGKLRDKLGIQGQSEYQAKIFRNKFLMKNILKHSYSEYLGYFDICHNENDLIKASKNVKTPFIIKPLASSGSIGVELVQHLSRVKEKNITYPLLIEEYIQGDMYHIDGLFSENKIQYISISKYINGCLAFNKGTFLGSIPIEKKDPNYNRILNVASHIIHAFPFPKISTFHLEVFNCSDGKIRFCEIASRTGGANINQCVQLNLGVNITELWVKGSLGDIEYPKVNITSDKYGFMLYPSKQGKLIRCEFEKLPDYIVDYKCFYKLGDIISPAKHSVDSLAAFIIRGRNSIEIENYMLDMDTWCSEYIELEG